MFIKQLIFGPLLIVFSQMSFIFQLDSYIKRIPNFVQFKWTWFFDCSYPSLYCIQCYYMFKPYWSRLFINDDSPYELSDLTYAFIPEINVRVTNKKNGISEEVRVQIDTSSETSSIHWKLAERLKCESNQPQLVITSLDSSGKFSDRRLFEQLFNN